MFSQHPWIETLSATNVNNQQYPEANETVACSFIHNNASTSYGRRKMQVYFTTSCIFMYPDSCLCTFDPDKAFMFFVLNSIQFHQGKQFPNDYSTTRYSQAMMDATKKHQPCEHTWGLTNQYWKWRQGVDHISVMTKSLHGFFHPRYMRGNYHYVHSQFQLKRHIVISVENPVGHQSTNWIVRLVLMVATAVLTSLGYDITTVHQTTWHILSMIRITLGRHTGRLKDIFRNIGNIQLFVVCLSAETTGT